MSPQLRTVDEIVSVLASRSHGVVTRQELLRAGLSTDAIRTRRERGNLIPSHRGVYRVGHQAPSVEARYLAAVLACGGGALLAGRAAAHLLALLKGAPPPPEVMCPTDRRVPDVLTRRCRKMHRNDATRVSGIPVTTVPRTLVDLAGALSLDDLARAVHEAQVRYRTTPPRVEAVLARYPNARGSRDLRAVLRGDVRVTLSRLERAFLMLLRSARLPLPRTNRPVGGHWVDCRWPEHRLTVELDSYRYHHSRYAWEQDRRRERAARARGDEFRRFTYGDVIEDPQYVLSEVRALLEAGRPV